MFSKIDRLKAKARKLYVNHQNFMGGYSCGAHMINTITGGELDDIAKEFNSVMDELALVDSSCPEFRLGLDK